ncbi:23S rRNA (adenine(1618)-N(6))-methyltransferase RlmF [Aequorivita sp. CIP111184]|uniref:23S rRNA (adenine(1618)-N(6))-methyltransferase RlmF n=1 Tax=Aequorivita sp. CIP111184 TaxID=2211356 RepID=UPI000DBC3CD9|nr:23S rRNA (adenine(1618)-N(6))-methyltransferase RlmF [Aequorivita sp. CIP111184]SRX53965.1 Ribosomal RNA large subunit methyltransferase F [Aequorivita sp. CIP111184]
MHQKNPFSKDYNFENLITHHPSLKEYVFVNEHGNNSIKFSNNQAVIALNTALLKAHYGINYWKIPDNNLCPPVPGRLDYLLHVAELLQKEDIKMLDIGTGANLIYPILACSHFNWQCTASEVDLDSLKNAQEIIAKNESLKDIELRHQKFKNSILEHIIQPDDVFDVVVCNPPFYKNRTDAERSNQRKVTNLQLEEVAPQNFGGSSNELWYKGGEEAFIKKMAAESVAFKKQVHWFTVLVSQKEHLKNIKRAINKTLPTEVRIIEMEQGNKQSRFIAWTFQ